MTSVVVEWEWEGGGGEKQEKPEKVKLRTFYIHNDIL